MHTLGYAELMPPVVAAWMANQGHEVICVDNCFTGTKQNIRHLLDDPLFEFLRHDITIPLYTTRSVEK